MGQEIGSQPAVGHPVIDRQHELGQRPDLHGATQGDHAIALPADRENRGLRGVDDGVEPVGPPGPEVGYAECGAFEFLTLEFALKSAVNELLALPGQLRKPELLDAMKDRYQESVLDGDHESDVRTGSGHDLRIRRERIA